MLTVAKRPIQPRAIAVIVALLTGCTFVMDRVVAFAIRPYVENYYNKVFVRKIAPLNMEEIMYIAHGLRLYYIVVFHFFVLVAVLLVFFHPKFKPFKRELLFAYLIILAAQVIWVIVRVISLKLK